ncbi:MAG: hypothetical protein WCD86_16270, partial [Ktedonobacteraceae bacterium]
NNQREDSSLDPVVQINLIGTLDFDAGALDTKRMEEMVRGYFHSLYERVDNNTNDQDYVADDGELDGRDRSTWYELERRIFEELVSRDIRFLPAREQWGAVLSELKRLALDKEDPARIAAFLREQREVLLVCAAAPPDLM